jgi:hypothetical protein
VLLLLVIVSLPATLFDLASPIQRSLYGLSALAPWLTITSCDSYVTYRVDVGCWLGRVGSTLETLVYTVYELSATKEAFDRNVNAWTVDGGIGGEQLERNAWCVYVSICSRSEFPTLANGAL